MFNDITLNVFRNFVPNKFITYDSRDPPWINDNIKSKIKQKNSITEMAKKVNKRKIPLIPPLFINNIFVINLNGKQIYLMNFLANNVDQ